MAIEQVKTINELERLPELLDAYALAVSTGSVTGSATLQQLTTYLKTFLESLENKKQNLDDPDNTGYPSTQAVFSALANLKGQVEITEVNGVITLKTRDGRKFAIQRGRQNVGSAFTRRSVNYPVGFINNPMLVITQFYWNTYVEFNANAYIAQANLANFEIQAMQQGFYWIAVGEIA